MCCQRNTLSPSCGVVRNVIDVDMGQGILHGRLFSLSAWSSTTVCARRRRHEPGGRFLPERFSLVLSSSSLLDLREGLFPGVKLTARLVTTISSVSTCLGLFISSNNNSKSLEYVQAFRKEVVQIREEEQCPSIESYRHDCTSQRQLTVGNPLSCKV